MHSSVAQFKTVNSVSESLVANSNYVCSFTFPFQFFAVVIFKSAPRSPCHSSPRARLHQYLPAPFCSASQTAQSLEQYPPSCYAVAKPIASADSSCHCKQLSNMHAAALHASRLTQQTPNQPVLKDSRLDLESRNLQHDHATRRHCWMHNVYASWWLL